MSIGYLSPDWGMAGEDASYTRAQAISEAKQEAFTAREDDIEYLVMKTAFEYREALKQCQDETPRQWEYRMSLRDGAAWISNEMMEVMEEAIEDDHYYTQIENLDFYADRFIEQEKINAA
ncbi:hypothetical protein [Neisseria mucosa]|uniref:hypothetical protein n=1 Tax=Neisseria mucosa TaxID=488 RepID=UPI0027E17D11|nr:hypothetical protein [Neisseria mucosa]